MTREADEQRLKPFRRSEVLNRHLYTIEHTGPDGSPAVYTVEVDANVDWDARLYVDEKRHGQQEMPAEFPVPGGKIEVNASMYGIQRVHFVSDTGEQTRLSPLPGTLEYLRARLAQRSPVLDRVIAWTAIVILVINLVLAVPQGLELLTGVPRVAELVGTFTSPVALPEWLNITLLLAGAAAAVERVLTLRRNKVLDVETIWSAF
ncbi:hypothetical protein [Prauserella cavernicola]|uniref:Uncharacterized protein n=1 Tax=Prauserella cavernicola TaxID=2800127 RepID=A0A934QQS1_9PSEU|nr:hypothetical protein [Prauserella cavernicola]MBK1783758.1 hypothetical protein [Prauserella cavernicola]